MEKAAEKVGDEVPHKRPRPRGPKRLQRRRRRLGKERLNDNGAGDEDRFTCTERYRGVSCFAVWSCATGVRPPTGSA